MQRSSRCDFNLHSNHCKSVCSSACPGGGLTCEGALHSCISLRGRVSAWPGAACSCRERDERREFKVTRYFHSCSSTQVRLRRHAVVCGWKICWKYFKVFLAQDVPSQQGGVERITSKLHLTRNMGVGPGGWRACYAAAPASEAFLRPRRLREVEENRGPTDVS